MAGGWGCAAALVAVLVYAGGGALVFRALEGAAPPPAPPGAAALRARAVERLWAITEDLNILYRDNWTRLAAHELRLFERALQQARPPAPPPPHTRWTFAGSFLYALTLITTIGPGEGWTVSAAGRAAGAVYAAGGIPLVLVYLACAGRAGGAALRRGWGAVRRAPPRPPPPRCSPFQAALNLSALPPRPAAPPRPPAALAAFITAGYVLLGALLFHATERWSLLDGCYFSFACLATIGFGELRPGLYASTVSARAEDLALAACCTYIVIGVAVVAMCFDLVQDDVTAALRGLAAWTGGGARVGLGAAPDAERALVESKALEPF